MYRETPIAANAYGGRPGFFPSPAYIQPSKKPGQVQILAIDECRASLMVLGAMLDELCAKATCVSGGLEGLAQLVAPHEYDAALLCVSAFGMDGTSLLRSYHAFADRNGVQTIPVYAWSAESCTAQGRRFTDLGFAGHLTKPLDFARLSQLVETLEVADTPAFGAVPEYT